MAAEQPKHTPSDRLAQKLRSLDQTLAYSESDANADTDMLGETHATVNVTALRTAVREALGIHEARAEFAQERLEALKIARHSLVTTHNLRATDLSEDDIARRIGDGAVRSDDLEWMIDHNAALAVIDAAIAKSEA